MVLCVNMMAMRSGQMAGNVCDGGVPVQGGRQAMTDEMLAQTVDTACCSRIG